MSVRKRLFAYIMCYVMALTALPMPVAAEIGGGSGGTESGSAEQGSESIDTKLTPITPKDAVSLNNNTLTYGQSLSMLEFEENIKFVAIDENGIAIKDKDGNEIEVEGNLDWMYPKEEPSAGTEKAEWKFVPTDSDTYKELTGEVKITVNKATPAITPQAPEYNKIFGDADFNLSVNHNNKDKNPDGTAAAKLQYNVTSGFDVVSVSKDGTVKILKVGTSEINVCLLGTDNYERSETKTIKITITCTHKGTPKPDVTDSTDTEEGLVILNCDTPGCTHEMDRYVIPKKTVEVQLGGTQKIISDASNCEIQFANEKDKKKCKKYFELDSKTGEVKAKWKKNYNVKIPKNGIPIIVVTHGQTYQVNVKITYPTPKIEDIEVSRLDVGYYRFQFIYNGSDVKKIKPDHVKIRCKNLKLNDKVMDRYLSSPKNTRDSYIHIPLKRPKNLTFTITAYYGKGNKNASETTKFVLKKSKIK